MILKKSFASLNDKYAVLVNQEVREKVTFKCKRDAVLLKNLR